jgi:hypothetical protein
MVQAVETTVEVDTKAVRRQAFRTIREELAGHVVTARAARKAIQEKKQEPSSPARGVALQNLWADKRYDSDTRRSLTLALAYLKGTPYASCEHKAVVAPYTSSIARILTDAGILTTAHEVGLWVTPAKAEEAAA